MLTEQASPSDNDSQAVMASGGGPLGRSGRLSAAIALAIGRDTSSDIMLCLNTWDVVVFSISQSIVVVSRSVYSVLIS